MRDKYNSTTHSIKITNENITLDFAISEYFDKIGYLPDYIAIIDSLGGLVTVIKEV
jgi:hypothetical protein